MGSMTLSDLSQMFLLRRDTVRVRQDLATATQELSTGRSADLGKATSGNFGPLASIDRQLSGIDGYETNAKEATLFFDTAQEALERIKSSTSEFSLRLTSTRPNEIITSGNVLAIEATAAFDLTVSTLNSRIAGRSLFAGTATDRTPVADARGILDQVGTAVAGLTTAVDVANAVDAWFTANFDTAVYQGSPDPLRGFRVGEGREVAMNVKGDDPAIRDQLKALATAALIGKTDISDPSEEAALANAAGNSLVSNRDGLITLQAGVGSAQERVEIARVEMSAERTALQIARSEIVAIDPYKVATDLQNLQTQLETIYTITARLSGLSLTNFIR